MRDHIFFSSFRISHKHFFRGDPPPGDITVTEPESLRLFTLFIRTKHPDKIGILDPILAEVQPHTQLWSFDLHCRGQVAAAHAHRRFPSCSFARLPFTFFLIDPTQAADPANVGHGGSNGIPAV